MKGLRDLIRRLLGHQETRRRLAGASLGTAVVLFSVAAQAAGGGGHHGEAHLNWWHWDQHAPPIGWFILDFIVFVGLLVVLARKPVSAMFQARHQRIREDIESSQASLARARAHADEYRDKATRVEEEANALIAGAAQDGAHTRDQMVTAATEYAARLKRDSEAAARQEAQLAEQRVRHQVGRDVLGAAQKLLQQELSDKDHERLIEDAIHGLSDRDSARDQAHRATGHAAVRATARGLR